MEDFERWWSIAVYWIDSNFQALRLLSPELLLAFGAISSFVTILFFCTWLYAFRRNKVLKRQIHSLTDELAVVQQKYESEVKWRMAADKIFGTEPARSVHSGDQMMK
jgi:membrane protein implicated in regulation of membrane protease activity